MIDEKEIQKKLLSVDKQGVIDGIMEMVFNADKSQVNWVSENLIRLAEHKDLDISGLSLTCFGHLARIYSNIGDHNKVLTLLNSKKDSPDLKGRVEDALEDIGLFYQIQ